MTLYRKRREHADTDEAIQWTGDNAGDVRDFCRPTHLVHFTNGAGMPPECEGRMLIADPDFPIWVERGDFITKSDAGELDVWEPENFGATYEQAGTGEIYARFAERALPRPPILFDLLEAALRCDAEYFIIRPRSAGNYTERLSAYEYAITEKLLELDDGAVQITAKGRARLAILGRSAVAAELAAAGKSDGAVPAPDDPGPCEYLNKQTEHVPDGNFRVQAMRYADDEERELAAADWAAWQHGVGWYIAEGMEFLESAHAFPINHGAGKRVKPGQWIVRYPDNSVEIFPHEIFGKLFYPAPAVAP